MAAHGDSEAAQAEQHVDEQERGRVGSVFASRHGNINESIELLERLVREAMESAMQLNVPLVVDTGWGETWGEAH